MEEINDLMKVRREKLSSIEAKGQNAYGKKFEVSSTIEDVKSTYNMDTPITVCVAGRVMTWRGHGKALFFDIKDGTGTMQVYTKLNDLEQESFEALKETDIGDILGVKGEVFKTRTGEITIKLSQYTLLAKSLRPLPEKWHGLRDVETRYRQRYVDLIVNPEVMDVFKKRSRIIKEIRSILDKKGYLEVETPMMQSIPGGAIARPFKTHHNALGIDLYLRIAPELFLKRLLVGGMEKVYEINRSFRNEGISPRHNPEFTMLEAYAAYADYQDMMDLTEEIICGVAESVLETQCFKYQNASLDLKRPWERLGFHEAIEKYADVKLDQEKDVPALAKKLGAKFDSGMIDDAILLEIFDEKVEPNLVGPVFIVDYPARLCPLTKLKEGQPNIAERFELYFGGQEVANAYSELNHPIIQKDKFEKQIEDQIIEGDVKCIDYDYVRALEYGMPPAGGLGIGIDRLVMILTNMTNIRDVILFPQMKPEQNG